MKANNFLRSLPKKRDFEAVFKNGVALASKNLVIYAKKNEFNYHRLGISVSKKIGGAVKRNKIKRLLREAMRKLGSKLSSKHYDFVIIGRTASKDAKLNDFIKEIDFFIKKL